ncbi:hypothetical protein [Trichormus variabilis]|uniref:hypothetical protein n=1 Tax=Anabaena variabilis TaxID=264691 RepID=UPI0018F2798E|nr:hypothetical protein [Trichormus variabilis]
MWASSKLIKLSKMRSRDNGIISLPYSISYTITQVSKLSIPMKIALKPIIMTL